MEPPQAKPKLTPEDIEALRKKVRLQQIGTPKIAPPISRNPLPLQILPQETAYGTAYEFGTHNYACSNCKACDQYQPSPSKTCIGCNCPLLFHLQDADDAEVDLEPEY